MQDMFGLFSTLYVSHRYGSNMAGLSETLILLIRAICEDDRDSTETRHI